MADILHIPPDILAEKCADAAIDKWEGWAQPEVPAGDDGIRLASSNQSPELAPDSSRPNLRLIESKADIRNERARNFIRSLVSKLPF